MLKPIRINQAVGNALPANTNDLRKISHGLTTLGHLTENDERKAQGYLTRSIDTAIREFQKDNGLAQDGRIEPDGPTIRQLNEILTASASLASIPDQPFRTNQPPLAVSAPPSPNGHTTFETPRISAAAAASNRRLVATLQRHSDFGDFPDILAKTILTGGEKERHEAADLLLQAHARDTGTAERLGIAVRQSLEKKNPSSTGRAGETQVALGPAVPIGMSLVGLLLGGAAAHKFGEMAGEAVNDNNPDQSSGRTTILPPQPNMITDPPPHPDPDDPINDIKTQPHLDPPTVFPGTILPVPNENRPQILIFPDFSGPLLDQNYYEDRKGNEETKAQLDRIRDWFLDHYGSRGWIHEAGGRKRGTGVEKPEYRIPGPGIAFEDPVTGKKGDSRPGSRYADLTFKLNRKVKRYPAGKGLPDERRVHIQTVDLDKNGKPTDRELQAAEAIRRATGDSVWLFDKVGRKIKILD